MGKRSSNTLQLGFFDEPIVKPDDDIDQPPRVRGQQDAKRNVFPTRYQWPDGEWRDEKPHPRGKQKPAEKKGLRKSRNKIVIDSAPSKTGRPRKPVPPYVEPTAQEIEAGLTDYCRKCRRLFLLTAINRQSNVLHGLSTRIQPVICQAGNAQKALRHDA